MGKGTAISPNFRGAQSITMNRLIQENISPLQKHQNSGEGRREEKRRMAQEIKEPCKKEACEIQACLSKNNFMSQRCVGVIEKLQACCEKCKYTSTHCGSVAGLLKQIRK